jgi:hypothetical protein
MNISQTFIKQKLFVIRSNANTFSTLIDIHRKLQIPCRDTTISDTLRDLFLPLLLSGDCETINVSIIVKISATPFSDIKSLNI